MPKPIAPPPPAGAIRTPDGREVVPAAVDASGAVAGVEVLHRPEHPVRLQDIPAKLLRWAKFLSENNRPAGNVPWKQKGIWFDANFSKIAAALKTMGATSVVRTQWNGPLTVYADPAQVDAVVKRLAVQGHLDQDPPLWNSSASFARLEMNEVGLRVLPRAQNVDEAAVQLKKDLALMEPPLNGGGDSSYFAYVEKITVDGQRGVLQLDISGLGDEFVSRLKKVMLDGNGAISYQGYPVEVRLGGTQPIYP